MHITSEKTVGNKIFFEYLFITSEYHIIAGKYHGGAWKCQYRINSHDRSIALQFYKIRCETVLRENLECTGNSRTSVIAKKIPGYENCLIA